ncbi:MAG: helix-turn-helix domain-containing protein [Thermoplasmata archaeon]
MYLMRCGIEHPGCWAVELADEPYIEDLTINSGSMLERNAIIGSLSFRSRREVDLSSYFPKNFVHLAWEVGQGSDRQYKVLYVMDTTGIPTTIKTLYRAGCSFRPPAYVKDSLEHFEIISTEKERLARLLDLLGKNDMHCEIYAIRELHTYRAFEREPVVSGILTPAQQRALRAAYGSGFYRFPKEKTLQEISEDLDLSRSTLREHLRRAEIRLVRQYMKSFEESRLTS